MQDRVCVDHTIRHHSGVVRSESTVEMAVLQLLVHLTLQKNLQKTVDKKASDCYNNIRRQGRQPRKPKIWGISSAGRALAWHARGQRFDPAILHQKARYFAGSMVLFFLLKPIFWGCIASPAPFSKRMFATRLFSITITTESKQKQNGCLPLSSGKHPFIAVSRSGGLSD